MFLLLWLFGSDVDDSTPDDTVTADLDPTVQPTGATTTGVPPSSQPDPDPTGDPTTDPSDEETEPADDTPVTAPPDVREEVGIANQTSVNGLAEFAKERLEDGGWDVPAVSTFNGSVPETTVYYPEGMRDAAEALSAQFPEIGRIQPTFEGLNPNRLVVVLVQDYVDEVGRP